MTQRSSQELQAHPVEPDAILEGWRALLATGRHLHAPDIARDLKVSEAALVAARIGQGAVRLIPDPAAVLSRLSQCGRVLCAFSNPSGVLMPLGHTRVTADTDGLLTLSGDHMAGSLDMGAVAEAFLFEDTDPNHGSSRSLQFFDAAGSPIVKVFIFHKGNFRAVSPHLLALSHVDQSRVPKPEGTVSVFDPQTVSLLADADGDEGGDDEMGGGDPQALIERFVAGTAGEPVQIEALSAHARVVWRGRLTKPAFRGGMLHLHETDLRAHLRLAPLVRAVRTAGDGIAFHGTEASGPQRGPGRLLRFAKEEIS